MCCLLKAEGGILWLVRYRGRGEVCKRQFGVREWRSTKLLDSLLCLRLREVGLSSMGNSAKITAVYQCDLQCEFESTVQARRDQERFSALQVALPLSLIHI